MWQVWLFSVLFNGTYSINQLRKAFFEDVQNDVEGFKEAGKGNDTTPHCIVAYINFQGEKHCRCLM